MEAIPLVGLGSGAMEHDGRGLAKPSLNVGGQATSLARNAHAAEHGLCVGWHLDRDGCKEQTLRARPLCG